MNGSPEFHDGYRADQNQLDPLAPEVVDFDWAALEEGLDAHQLQASEFERLGDALHTLLDWIIPRNIAPATLEKVVARRAIALAWCISPAYFEGSPSLTRLAAEIGVNKVLLSRHTADVRRRFGVSNRSQAHGWNFERGGSDAG